jgi:hypothetical protein
VAEVIAIGPRLWSQAQLAQDFELDRRTVKKRLAGVQPAGTTKHGYPTYRIRDAAPALLALAASGDAEDADPERLPPKDRKDWYDGELRRLQLQERARQLVPESDVRREMATLLKAVGATLETLPDVLERDAGIGGAAVERAQLAIDALREQLFRALTDELEPDGEA